MKWTYFGTREKRDRFLLKYGIEEATLKNSLTDWETLELIYQDFQAKQEKYNRTATAYAEALRKCEYTHSLSYRIKDPEHLMEKIIRKNNKHAEEGDLITAANYEEKITDLIGIRVLLIFKEDWEGLHNFILEHYKQQLNEPPFVYIRKGDDRSLYEGKLQILEERPYRSAHYVIKAGDGQYVEIQVRTLYEEAWSEIDHKLRYPYNVKNRMINQYMELLNRITGIGDEMGTFIHRHIELFETVKERNIARDIGERSVYANILQELENCTDEKVKENITRQINQAEEREMLQMRELFDDVMGMF